ncbi:AAA-ATPase ASD, mitochondrial-like isoform X2 [Sesamum indicum]|uniref:AAA-ATPase ASD, mitochondrial-like isoform X2 n=1 Tax=Sesamum indicum TaxID=4182 RepID=A0A6I9TE29_SESIN|nr:AAA-ATPase ASD, mitochondrial-like isoform X2 [Sesamum indicum]
MRIGEIFAQLGSILAAFMFMKAIIEQYFPHHLRSSVEKHSQKLLTFLSPYVQITFNEFTGERLFRSEAYSAIETYLSSNSSAQASRLKADVVKNSSQAVSLSMDDNEEVADEFSGVKVWWASGKNISKTQTFSFHPVNDEKRFYNLRFHKKHRKFITETYINHVLKEGKSIEVRNRQRKLYTNSGSSWSHVPFEHPATFQTLAMEPEKKRDIVDDLLAFSKAKDFYAGIGRAWKRGYLLYGPPGTGQRTKRREKKELEEDDPLRRMAREATESKTSNITLSGLLNFIDGLWSACGAERIIVFTTNYVENLDPALIRRGRMDKHIELSYCSFEGFKVLAKNYLGLEWHHLFPRIESLLGGIKITPADVAESLMPKTVPGNAEICLENLILALEEAGAKASLKNVAAVG